MNPRVFCRERDYPFNLLLSWSFDALFFEQVALHDLIAGGAREVLVVADPVQIEGSSSRWASSAIHLGRRYVLEPARVADGQQGDFHPKVFIRMGPRGALVWLGSGNLSFGGWGGNRELAATWRVGPDATDAGGWLLPLLDSVTTWCEGNASGKALKTLRQPWVEEAASRTPPADSPVLFSAGASSLSGLLGSRWAGRRFTEAQVLTGSSDEGGAQLRWLGETFGVERARVAVNPHSVAFDPALLERLPLEVRLLDASCDPPPLHAKGYLLRGPDGDAGRGGRGRRRGGRAR